MKNYLIPCALILVLSCDKGEVLSDEPAKLVDNSPVIEIIAPRIEGNIFCNEKMLTKGSAAEYGADLIVNSNEMVVMPEMASHMWLGNVLKADSVPGCDFTPVSGTKSPITVSTSLYGVPPTTISRPSNSAYLRYVRDVIERGNLQMNEDSRFALTQFSSYDELKQVFGSNVNTNAILFSKNKESVKETYHIKKATGLCVKFYQTSFKVFMDDPGPNYIPDLDQELRNSSVYVNSITYGRLGILTMETNYAVDSAVSYTNKIIKNVLFKNNVNFTKEEKNYINSCDFRLYLVGGDGSEAVKTFAGLDAFMEYVRKDTFTVESPGAPILCTFNKLSDGSPFNIKFAIKYERVPVYAELVAHSFGPPANIYNLPSAVILGDLYVYCYSNEDKVPAIAPSDIRFKIRVVKKTRTTTPYSFESVENEYYVNNKQNTTKVFWKGNVPSYLYYPVNGDTPVAPETKAIKPEFPQREGTEIFYSYYLVPTEDYKVLGVEDPETEVGTVRVVYVN